MILPMITNYSVLTPGYKQLSVVVYRVKMFKTGFGSDG